MRSGPEGHDDASRTAARSGHVRTRRPRLRADRHDGDGRHVPRRATRSSSGMGLGAHDGRASGDDRARSRSCRRCCRGWATSVEKGRVPFVRRRRAKNSGESRMWGVGHRRACCERPRCRRSLPRRVLVALGDAGLRHADEGQRRIATLPAGSAGDEGLQPHAKAFPGKDEPGGGRGQGRGRPCRRRRNGDRAMKQRAVASGEMLRARSRRGTARTTPSPRSAIPIGGRR